MGQIDVYINRTRPKHGYKYTKCKMCFSLMMAMCEAEFMIKLSNAEE